MDYKFGLLLAAAYVSVTSALPPCVCTRNLLPVCGSDGVTYANECLLECAQTRNQDLTVKKRGSCEPEPPMCVCTFIYSPVCGSDGKSYPNECALDCEKAKTPELEMRNRGECEEKVKVAELPTCICTRDKKPVCGTNGKTYNNMCLLNCDSEKSTTKIDLDHDGPCDDGRKVKVVDQPASQSPCVCTRNLSPVCGTNGKTYNNMCLLNCDSEKSKTKIDLDHDGPCDDGVKVKVVEQPATQSPCVCTRNLSPVCGTNGKTYNNMCLLNCDSEKSKTKIDLDHDGPCDDGRKVKVVEQPASQSPCVCTRNLSPVCGSDGVTYNNECLLRCAGKDLQKAGPC